MFLEPEPKRSKHGHVMSTLPSPRPSAAQRQLNHSNLDRPNQVRRKPLQERTKSQNNQQTPTKAGEKLLLNLTKDGSRPLSSSGRPNGSSRPSSRPSSLHRPRSSHRPASLRSIGDSNSIKNAQLFSRPLPRLPTPSPNDATPVPASAVSHHAFSEKSTPAHELPALEFPPRVTLFPKTVERKMPRTVSHRRNKARKSVQQSTVEESETSAKPTSDVLDTLELNDLLAPERATEDDPTHTSDQLDDTSPERSIRLITDDDDEAPASPESRYPRSLVASIVNTPSLQSGTDGPETPRSRLSLAGSSSNKLRGSALSNVIKEQDDAEDMSRPASPFDNPESPIIVVFGQDTPISKPSSHPLRVTPSIESIQQRLQYPTVVRPERAKPLTLKTSESGGSLTSSNGTLPSLSIPRRRQRAMSASAAHDAPSGSDHGDAPFRRSQYDHHLSTILSESDTHSWIANQRMTFSPGSDGSLGDDDDVNTTGFSGTWPATLRTGSATYNQNRQAPSVPPHGTIAEEGPGDMTLGVYRQESAKPQPLFLDTSEGRRYMGEAPPLPPVPKGRDSEENFDTVSELQSPALHPMRSNYSLRQRSNSTGTTVSRQQSNGEVNLPVWARNFYSGKWQLLSASKVSLALPPPKYPARMVQPGNVGRQRSFSDLSVISRIGTGYSNVNSEARQEQFRQQLRQLQYQNQAPRANHWRSSSAYSVQSVISRQGTEYTDSAWTTAETVSEPNVEYFHDERPPARMGTYRDDLGPPSSYRSVEEAETRRASRIDSMEIFANPMRMVSPSVEGEDDGDVFNSPRPRQWAGITEGPTPPKHKNFFRSAQRPHPRDDMEIRRQEPVLGSYSDLQNNNILQVPHLMPSKRVSQQGLSIWPPPSFVESLGSLLHSRCNRQISLFAVGFICPILWIVAAVLPLPERPMTANDLEKNLQGSDDHVQAAMMKHYVSDPERRQRDERQWLKAVWWRGLNRIMSVVGCLVIGAVIALAVVATK